MSKRVFVKIKTKQGIVIPSFAQCLMGFFEENSEGNSSFVQISLDKAHLLLSPASHNDTSHILHHSPHCPFKELDEDQTEEINSNYNGVVVAVSMLIESQDQHVLLTRRPAHMRASPNVWVPPGGHLEVNEGLLEGGARELLEETGLDVATSCDLNNTQILCLWENVFPLLLGFGAPRNHSVVIYYHLKSQYTFSQLTDRMKIDPEEVGAFTWLSRKHLTHIFNSNDHASSPCLVKQYVWENDKINERPLNYLEMFNRFVWTGNRFYSGAMCSLKTWYHNKDNPSKI